MMGIGIFMLPFYLKYLGAEAYGLVGFFTMLQYWMMLMDFGLSGTLSRESAKLKDSIDGRVKLKGLIRSIESIYLIIVLSILIIIIYSSSWISQNWLNIDRLSLDSVIYSIELMGVMIAIRWYVSLYRGAIVGFEDQVWLNLYNISIATLKYIGAYILIRYINNDILYFFVYQLLVSIIEFFVIRYRLYNSLPKTNLLMPSFSIITEIAPFALGLAYTSAVWIIFTQLDKLILSHYLPLKEYGYFTLIVLISSAIMQISGPLSQAIIPRMTSLLANKKEDQMLKLYHTSTQFLSIVIFSVVGIISLYSYELLYSWSGDVEASRWASPILPWYIMGNGILVIGAFQYYLQYAHGNLKYHIRMNTIFPIVTLPIILYSIVHYGAIGAAIAWFWIQLVGFIVWPPFIHHKFASGIHRDWIIKDILPSFIMTIIYISILKYIDIEFTIYNRVETFFILIVLGIILLICNILVYPNIRGKIIGYFHIITN